MHSYHHEQKAPRIPQFTPREYDVIGWLVLAKTNYAIAKALSVSEGAIENHLTSIYRKLNAYSRCEAVVALLHLINDEHIVVPRHDAD